MFLFDGGMDGRPIAQASNNEQNNKVPVSDQSEKIRSDFRESWIWQTVKVG